MRPENKYALDAAKEIVVASLGNAHIPPCAESGEAIAEFYEEIYKRVLSLAETGNDPSQKINY